MEAEGFQRVVLTLLRPGVGTLDTRTGSCDGIQGVLLPFHLAVNEKHLQGTPPHQWDPVKIECLCSEMDKDEASYRLFTRGEMDPVS